MNVAYQGLAGAYSEAAASALFPEDTPLSYRTFADVFAALADEDAGAAVVPVENSHAGVVADVYDLLHTHRDARVVAEIVVRVRHSLLGVPGARLDGIKVARSHPQALAQCERFLSSLTGVHIEAVYDTAGGAKLIRDGELRDAAAIASRRAAEVFQLDILREGIQDFDANITRFVAIARSPVTEGADKTSVVFALEGKEPGSLFKALSVFALRNINLTKLESRPIRGRPWEYMFYADIAVPRDDLQCARALVHLGEFARWVRTLGTYRAWREPASAVPGKAPAAETVR
jgi:prephenate dehydratase